MKEPVKSKADELAIDQGCTFKVKEADRVRFFLKTFCRHSKGEWAGKPFELLDWQWTNIIAPLFGWRRPDGTRRYRRGGIWVAKKNGKSSLGSALSLYMLIGDGEPGAEIYNAASDRDQAGIVYNEAKNMVAASPALSAKLKLVASVKRIVYPAKNAWLKALSADVPTKEGLNWHFLLFDELHAQAKRDLWDTLVYGGAARRQPLLLSISTAGFDRESIGYEQYLYAKAVLEGRSEDTAFFTYISEAGKEDDWKSPATWQKANPSLGVTIREQDLAEACREAQDSPAKENSFRRYRLNQWTDSATRWIASEKWDACNEPVNVDSLAGRPCYAGLDLSSTLDTSSLVLLFPLDDGTFAVLLFVWVPEEACRQRERKNRQRYDEWIRRGWMIQTGENSIDYSFIRAKIKELGQLYLIEEIAFDRWNATSIAGQLQDEDGFKVVAFGQGYASMSEPTKELEKLILDRKIRHGDNPVLRWMIGNTVVKLDPAGNIKPDKEKSTEKIDGVVSLVMALGRAMLRPEHASIYETRGILRVDSAETAAKQPGTAPVQPEWDPSSATSRPQGTPWGGQPDPEDEDYLHVPPQPPPERPQGRGRRRPPPAGTAGPARLSVWAWALDSTDSPGWGTG